MNLFSKWQHIGKAYFANGVWHTHTGTHKGLTHFWQLESGPEFSWFIQRVIRVVSMLWVRSPAGSLIESVCLDSLSLAIWLSSRHEIWYSQRHTHVMLSIWESTMVARSQVFKMVNLFPSCLWIQTLESAIFVQYSLPLQLLTELTRLSANFLPRVVCMMEKKSKVVKCCHGGWKCCLICSICQIW